MQVATALRIVSVVVAAKALLIGVVYWRRAEILGRPVHIGAGSWACLIAVVTIGVAIALTVQPVIRTATERPDSPSGWPVILLGWRAIDGSTRHDAHAELNPRPGRCCVVVHGAQ
ncbi:MAG TPA: hypothetical protein VFP27_01675 [Mycobacterium sp.]|nr:hypothetical protein [Mycobacterium sp.]